MFGRRRERKRSQEIIELAVASGDPFSYLYDHMDEMACVCFDDLMCLFRAYPAIKITSHDIVEAYERHMIKDNRHTLILWDLIYLLRNRGMKSDVSE